MKRVDNVDQHGFPIPPGFDDQPSAAPRRKSLGRKSRWVIVALLVAVVGSLLVESPLSTTGRTWVAWWYCSRADEKIQRNDKVGALAEVDWAIWWLPDQPRLYQARAELRYETKDFQGSLDDYARAIELDSNDVRNYLGRGMVHERMGNFRQAINDATQAVKRAPQNPLVLNSRAYFRALAGIELKEGLEDIEKALELTDKRKDSMLIDTRGWLHFRLGNTEAALKDLDQAVELATKDRQRELDYLYGHGRPRYMIERVEQKWDQNLAVMYHHRGEALQKLGQLKEAKADLEQGDKLGYNPAEGVL